MPRDDSEGPAEGRTAGSSTVASTSKNQSLSKYQGDVTQLLNEVAAIKRHQTLLLTELRERQKSDSQLWQENLQHKARHDRNQDMIDKILKFLAGVFGGRALNEGTGFTSGNIAAADSMSGLGLNSYSQNSQNIGQSRQQDSTSGKVQEQSASPSDSYAMVNVPRKRRRLLLESPDKSAAGQSARSNAGSAQPAISSQFEEIASDEDIPVFEELNGSTGTQSAENSPAQPALSSFGAIQPPEQQQQGATKSQPSTLPMDDLTDIDWPAMNALFNAPGTDASGSNSNPNNLYDYTNPSFYNSFSDSLPSQSDSSTSNLPLFSPNTLANAQAIIDSQALTKYNGGVPSSANSNSLPPTSVHEQHLKTRLDTLGEQLDKLVAQLPPSFDFSAQQQPSNQQSGSNNNMANPDDFDFSQYRKSGIPSGPRESTDWAAFEVDNLNDTPGPDEGNTFDNAQDPSDPLAAYLDPALTGSGTGIGKSSSVSVLPPASEQVKQSTSTSIGDQTTDPLLVKQEPAPASPSLTGKPIKSAKTAGKQPMKSTGGRGQKRLNDNISDSPANGTGRGTRSTRARLGT
jgi:hypothetical protein